VREGFTKLYILRRLWGLSERIKNEHTRRDEKTERNIHLFLSEDKKIIKNLRARNIRAREGTTISHEYPKGLNIHRATCVLRRILPTTSFGTRYTNVLPTRVRFCTSRRLRDYFTTHEGCILFTRVHVVCI